MHTPQQLLSILSIRFRAKIKAAIEQAWLSPDFQFYRLDSATIISTVKLSGLRTFQFYRLDSVAMYELAERLGGLSLSILSIRFLLALAVEYLVPDPPFNSID